MRARVLCRRRAPRHGLSLRPPRRSTRRDVRAGEVSGRPTTSSVTSLRAPGSGTSRASCSPLYNDIARQLLPLELGFGSGQTCWRRLDRWQEEGVFDRLHQVLLAELHAVGELDWSRACVDGSHIRAKRSADTGPPPVDRRRTGSKHHLICDGSGTPLEVITTTANVNDITQTDNLIDGIPPVAGRARPTATAPRVHPGQQGVRLEGRTPETAAPQDSAVHLPQGRPERQGPGPAPLRRRADSRPAPPVQTSRCPMGTTPRTPRRLGLIGLQPHLLETPQED
ncbi:transposase [Streptomyces sp. CH-036]|uniref:transposase n=1 Tax=Streptomyces sp. CH-036 TaxID=3406733 RepID=UPI003C76390D